MNFGQAIELLKRGHYVQREGWNGKGMYLLLIEGVHVEPAISKVFVDIPKDMTVAVEDAVYMKNAQGSFIPWLASQADMLAEDWEVLE